MEFGWVGHFASLTVCINRAGDQGVLGEGEVCGGCVLGVLCGVFGCVMFDVGEKGQVTRTS